MRLLGLCGWSALCGLAMAREVSAPLIIGVALLVGAFVAAKLAAASPTQVALGAVRGRRRGVRRRGRA